MLVDYYVVQRGAYAADILRGRGGRYWYRGGVNPAAVAVWAVGAVCSLVLTYVLPSPVGATIPTFVLSAALYLLWALAAKRIVPGRPVQRHLAEAGRTGTDGAGARDGAAAPERTGGPCTVGTVGTVGAAGRPEEAADAPR
jgi:uncharacterized membrane protein YfcA